MKMNKRSFNLVDQPWIKVIDKQNKLKKVSLAEIFEHAQDFRQLAGEMRSQDLAILRFLLAILTTVYTRIDSNDEIYEDLDNNFQVDEDDRDSYSEDLLDTWGDLYQKGSFTQGVTKYLEKYYDRFDFFGEHPFYQVSKEEYNSLVPDNKKVEKGKGTVAVKQLNRTISESANSPDIFTPKYGDYKNIVKIDELVRWIITYQNFTGVTDKTKVNTQNKFSISRGWLYGLNPVYIKGKDLFQTLIFNLKMPVEEAQSVFQKPVWEFNSTLDYIKFRSRAELPDNIAGLYTVWSRVLHIEWNYNFPLIFSAGLPKLDNMDAFIEPMTTWKFDQKESHYRPNPKWLKSMGESMWRNFGQYVKTQENDDPHKPGIIRWIRQLKENSKLSINQLITLATVGLINDGNATSQSPAAEVFDEMSIKTNVLLAADVTNPNYWPARIEEEVQLTKKVADFYYRFMCNIANLRSLADTREFASRETASLYEKFNRPFLSWLASLSDHEDRDLKIQKWRQELKRIVFLQANDFVSKQSSPQDIIGKNTQDGNKTIFDYYRNFKFSVLRVLAVEKTSRKEDEK